MVNISLKITIILLSLAATAISYSNHLMGSHNSESNFQQEAKKLFSQESSTNPWHAVSYGPNCPSVCQSIIQIPKESRAKYELDKATGMLKLDRVLYSAVHYPANYGFLPQTLCQDHDPLDILVISSVKIQPLCLIDAKIIGYVRMIDSGLSDNKLIAVAKNDMSVGFINELSQLPPNTLEQIMAFYTDYKKLEKKVVQIDGYGGRQEAYEVVRQSIDLYKQTYGSMSFKNKQISEI